MAFLFKPNIKNIRALTREPGAQAMIAARAQRVAAAADQGSMAGTIKVISDITQDGRARTRVVSTHPKARFIEAHRGYLARALDQGGGGE